MSVTTNYSDIYSYITAYGTSDDVTDLTDTKCKTLIKAIAADYIQRVDSEAVFNHTAFTVTTTAAMTELQKNVLGLMCYREYMVQENKKWSTIMSITNNAFSITDSSGVKRALQSVLDKIDKDLENKLATLLTYEY